VAVFLLRRFLVTLIAIFTFGFIIPDFGIYQKTEEIKPNTIGVDEQKEITEARESKDSIADEVTKSEVVERLLANTYVKANEITKRKFGNVIEARVGDSFEEEILPKIVETVKQASESFDIGTIQNLNFTMNPPGGLTETIFNVYDERTGNDVLRFHVRRENPPKQGHFFSFHYHTKMDSFENHYELGKLYWDKNTPPKWKKTA
jgi:hypothetical protein